MAVQRVQIPISFQYLDASTPKLLIPVPTGTTVAVFDRNTAAPATVYSAATAGTIVSPLQTDSSGAVNGWVVEGSYTFSVIANAGASPPYGGVTIAWDAARGDGVEAIYPGTVTSAHLNSALTPFLLSPGMMLDFAGGTAPAGYVLCNGASYSTTGTMAALFAVIGYTFGGSGPNFNVPDYRGRTSVGTGTGIGGGASGTGKPAGGNALTARARSDWYGDETHLLTSVEMAVHNHTVVDPTHAHSVYDPGHQHYASGTTGGSSALHNHTNGSATPFYASGGAGDYNRYSSLNSLAVAPYFFTTGWVTSDHSHAFSNYSDVRGTGVSYGGSATGVSVVNNVTNLNAYPIRQPYMVLNKIIKL